MANHNDIGRLGEDLSAKWLSGKGFQIIVRNYLKKCGEIDIVARETNQIHFVEVKSVSYETKQIMELAVSRGTWRPEENVHRAKQKRLSRVIGIWLDENKYDGKWQIDILSVRIVPSERIARFNLLDNVIFD